MRVGSTADSTLTVDDHFDDGDRNSRRRLAGRRSG